MPGLWLSGCPSGGAGIAPLATRDQSLDPLSLRDRRRETAARAASVPLAGKCLGDLSL